MVQGHDEINRYYVDERKVTKREFDETLSNANGNLTITWPNLWRSKSNTGDAS